LSFFVLTFQSTIQSKWEVSEWNFINKLFNKLKNEAPNLPKDFYEFAFNELFVNSLQNNLNEMFSIAREFMTLKKSDNNNDNIYASKVTAQKNKLVEDYLNKLMELRSIAEKYSNTKFEVSNN